MNIQPACSMHVSTMQSLYNTLLYYKFGLNTAILWLKNFNIMAFDEGIIDKNDLFMFPIIPLKNCFFF